MPSNKEFWDKAAAKYFTDPISDEASYEAGLAKVREWLKPEMRALEIGCGTGMTALKLAASVRDFVGTDLSPEMVKLARHRAKEAGTTNVEFAAASSVQAGNGDRFDAVLAFNLLHLVNDVDDTMAHARSLLPEGGLFISKTPCLSKKFYFRPLIGLMQLIGKAPKPVHLLSVEAMGQHLRRAGFEILEQGGYPRSVPSQLIIARAV